MKILIVEDYGIMYNNLLANFKEHKNVEEVFGAFQVSEAMDKFEEKKPDFILLDIYIPTSGLKKEEIDQSHRGKIAGWLWFYNYVLPLDNNWRNKIIIYSEYINILKKHIDKSHLSGIKLLSKGNHHISEVIDTFTQMTKDIK